MQKTWYQSIWYWRLAIFECLTDAFISMAMVWMASVANADWDQLTPTARKIIYVSAIVAGLKTVKSFLSTTISVLQDAMPMKPGTTHEEITQVSKTVTDTPISPSTNPPVESGTK